MGSRDTQSGGKLLRMVVVWYSTEVLLKDALRRLSTSPWPHLQLALVLPPGAMPLYAGTATQTGDELYQSTHHRRV